VLYSAIVCAVFFIVSNFLVWTGTGGYARPHTFNGLMLCYVDGLPFLQWSFISTLVFSGILFGSWKWLQSRQAVTA
jgi:hypothetical protein